jgi:hypothetical protein
MDGNKNKRPLPFAVFFVFGHVQSEREMSVIRCTHFDANALALIAFDELI